MRITILHLLFSQHLGNFLTATTVPNLYNARSSFHPIIAVI